MRKIRKAAIVVMMMAMILSSICVVEAKKTTPRNGWYTDYSGTYYYRNGKPKTGYFKVHGKTYYGHKTNSVRYPKGSITKGQMRIRNGKWYAFRTDGARYDKDAYVNDGRRKIPEIDIRSRDHTVRYVYETARTRLGYRYSTREKRLQQIDDNGKWRTVEGMQFIPSGWVDWQK